MGYIEKISFQGLRIKDSSIVLDNHIFQVNSSQREYTIGRASDCDMQISFPYSNAFGISRHHCVLVNEEDGVYLRDDSSSKGTFIDGRRLMQGELAALTQNSLVGLGEVCKYRVRLEKDESWKRNGNCGLLGRIRKLLKV